MKLVIQPNGVYVSIAAFNRRLRQVFAKGQVSQTGAIRKGCKPYSILSGQMVDTEGKTCRLYFVEIYPSAPARAKNPAMHDVLDETLRTSKNPDETSVHIIGGRVYVSIRKEFTPMTEAELDAEVARICQT